VVDLPRAASACTQQILQSATDLLLVTDLSLAGMRDTMRITGTLPTTNASCNTVLVVNRAGEHKQGEMPRAEFEKGVGRKLDLVLPFDAKTVAAATNFGQPVAAGKGAVANGLRSVTDRLCGAQAAGEARASAMIIGSLPFVMAGVISFVNPEYMSTLFTDPRGWVMIGIGLTSLLIGLGIMAKLIKFEI
jgi:Flp pilus assembly CpaE family ATPase